MRRRTAIISLIFVGIMLLSTFAYAGIQAAFFSPPSQPTELPNIISTTSLTPQQTQQILQQGSTLVTLNYQPTCLNCTVRSYLEQAAKSPYYKQQIYLNEISSNYNSVTITSQRGSQTLTDPTQDHVTAALCDILLQPPISCALSKV